MKNLLVINVLPANIFEDCHIKGSFSVPYEDVAEYALNLDKNVPIVVYCASYLCRASSKAWHLLKDLGFTNVRAYEGGTAEWFQLDYPIEGTCKENYLQQKELPEERNIQTITTEELKKEMAEAGLL